MNKILFLTNVIRRMGIMEKTLKVLLEKNKNFAKNKCIWITDNTEWNDTWQDELNDTNVVLVKWMGTGVDTVFLKKMLHYLDKKDIAYYIDAAGTDEKEYFKILNDKQVNRIREYSMLGGEENYSNLWNFVDKCITHEEQNVESPHPMSWCGIYHPRAEKEYNDLKEYSNSFLKSKQITVGVLFHRDEWVWGDLEYQTELINKIEASGMNAVCVFSNGLPDEELGIPSLAQVFEKYFSIDGIPAIDVLLNTTKFSMTSSGSMTLDFLKQWNIPVIEAYTIMTGYENWKNSFEGMNAMEVSISIALPEFDGVIHGVPVAFKKVLDNGDVRYKPIHERIDRTVAKAKKWANLRRKINSEKKIAIIFHNYPPKNSNIGSAVGLDSIESVRLVLAAMVERGYKIDYIPEDGKTFINQLTANATNDRTLLTEKQIADAQKVTAKQYLEFFDCMSEKVKAQMEKDWGKAPGKVMEYDSDILVPGTLNGNVFVTVQPPRGFGEDPSKIYHDPFTAPTHQYLAFYYWLREIWKADAVAHIGTHGSLEWLPGKNAGLSCECYPDLALGDLPNIYPYLITITGEGIQAKRRGSACLIEYLPAPQTQAGIYDELEELEKIMDEYVHFQTTQPDNLPKLEELVKEKVQQANLQDEVIYDESKPFGEYVMALHNYITDLKNMQVHTGLHILGKAPEDEQLIDYLCLLTRLDNGDIPSLNNAVASVYGFEYEFLLENSSLIYEPQNIIYGLLIDRIAEQCREIIKILKENDFSFTAYNEIENLAWVKNTDDKFKEKLKIVCRYICETVYPNLVLTKQELDNMLRGFEGEYIEPGPSGAPSSGGADLLPTGRNFFGIDPRILPTPAAWEIGKNLGDQVINRFIDEEGYYPESIGIVLWSGSNMRSHGQCIAEFLYLLGIKPIWQKGSMRVTGLEVIPLIELKRPRIDVTARISGLFRDSMPSVMNLLDKAVLLVSKLEEDIEQNYVRKHILEDSAELEKDGMNKEEAWRQAAYRIFGDQQGTYGAGIANLLESKNWNTIDDLADVYVRWGAHAYGGKTKGKFLPQMFKKRIGSLDVTIKNEDNHETNMLSSDDYNAYHGGMIAAVRSIKGSAPKSYCGDSTDRNNIKMHSVQEQAKRIFRSEAINPKFIEGMMKHGYKGALDMSNYVAHSFQWDATSKVMEDWMYEKYAEKYAFDPKVQEWLRDVNPWALQRMTETLLEANQRGLWNAKQETLDELRKLYLDIDGELEDRADANS